MTNLPSAGKFPWTGKSDLAAQRLAEGAMADSEIATEVGISTSTLARWKRDPQFEERITENADLIRKAIRKSGIAVLENRVTSLNSRWEKLNRIIEARAKDPAMKDVPGGDTGLLVKQLRAVGSGENAQIVEEFAVDTALLREIRDHERQASQELGQWLDKTQINHVAKAYELFDGWDPDAA